MEKKVYIAIDLKSFYASVECVERGLDPMTTNLVVADPSRTEKTICLAVSPGLKSFGVPGRPRLFEVIQQVGVVNARRRAKVPTGVLTGSSCNTVELAENKFLAVDYMVAPPRMGLYMEYSTRIYDIYLKYVSEEDIFAYSVDEVFIDATHYLKYARMTPVEFTRRMILDVFNTTGITAAAGIGTNMFLCKIAMDIEAKKIPGDEHGVRIAELDEMSFRQKLWDHRPLTDFWRIGGGYASKLEAHGMYTLGDVALCSEYNEELLYEMFGKNAELLIDHAWGWEPCTMDEIKAYKPQSSSLSSGQVLQEPYKFDEAKLVIKEMTDSLTLDLVEKGLVTDQMVLTVGYDVENLKDIARKKAYGGNVVTDRYGRRIPQHAHGTANLGRYTSSTVLIMDAVTELFDRIVDRDLLIRRLTIVANRIVRESDVKMEKTVEQIDLFCDYEEMERQRQAEEKALAREKSRQKAVLNIKNRFGKNAILRGMDLEKGATARERNAQIGGHKA